MCVDFRALNLQTRKDVYPLPRIEDLLDRLTRAHYFTKIDLAQGYHQVQITPEQYPRSAFLMRFSLIEWVVMPFSLSNAPSTF